MEVMKEYYNRQTDEVLEIKRKWWMEPKEEIHRHVFGVVNRVKENQTHNSVNNLRYARLYSNKELTGLAGGLYSRTANQDTFLKNRVTYNVIKSCIDTACSKIAKNKPRPVFLTEAGLWNTQRKAKTLTKYMEGAFEKMGKGWGDTRTLYGIARSVFKDCCVFGTGVAKLYFDEAEGFVKAERILSEEIIVDDLEGRYGNPRQLHQQKLAHREVLMQLFPKHKEKILMAAPADTGDVHNNSSADMVEVVESWHLRSGPDAKDGKRTVCIDNCTLVIDEYDKDYFPFLFMRWSSSLLGFFGAGLAEELVGIQLEINKILRAIQIAHHLVAVPQVWLEIQSKAVAKHINNEIGGIKYYTGRPPTFMTPTAFNAESYRHLEALYAKAFEITGISMLSATSKKPAGLDSGVALREYQDIETDRFSLVAQMYTDFFMDATYMTVDFLRQAKKDGINPVIQIKDNQSLKSIRFSDVDIPDDKMTIKAYPSALLPQTPAGKLQQVQEMLQAGFYSREEALDLLDFPDTAKVNKVKLAPRKAVEKLLDQIIEKAEYEPPEPFMDLNFAQMLSQSYYLLGRSEDMPENRLELLRRFMSDVEGLKNRQLPPPEPGMESAALDPNLQGGMEQAIPEALPTSELMPQAV